MVLKALSSAQSRALLAHLGGGAPGGTGEQLSGSKHQTPLDWILDMADRPRRAVAQVTEAIGDTAYDAMQGHFDPLKSAGNIASAPFRGLFSNNPTDQETTSQEFEHFERRALKTIRPGTTDHDIDVTEKKIGPTWDVAKGAVGLIGDVATDPLTYVPGIDVVSAGRKVFRAARGAEDVGDALKGAGRDLLPGTEKLKERVLGPTQEAKRAKIQADLDALQVKIDDNAKQRADLGDVVSAASRDAEENVAPAPTSAEVQNMAHPEEPVVMEPEPPKVSTLLQNHPQAQRVLSFLDTVGDQGAFSKLSGGLNKADDAARRLDERKLARAEEAVERHLNTPYPKTKAGQQIWDQRLTQIEAERDGARSRIAAAGPAVSSPAPVSAGTAALDQTAKSTSTLDRVKQLVGTDAGRSYMETQIGDTLTRELGNYSDPDSFDRMVHRLRTVASGDKSLDFLEDTELLPKVDTPERSLLTATGIDPVAINTHRREWRAMSEGLVPGTTPGVSDSRDVLTAVKSQAKNSAVKVTGYFDSEKAALAGLKQLDEHLRVPQDQYRFATKQGVSRTADKAGEGEARYGNRIDSHGQYSMLRAIRKHVEATMEKRFPRVDVQTARKIRAGMELKAQRLGYDTLDGSGVPIAATFRDEHGVETVASLTKLEAYEQLAGSPEGKELMDFLFFGKGSNLADTQFLAGLARLVRGDDLDDVMATITAGVDRNGKAVPNWPAKGDTKVFAQIRPKAQKALPVDVPRPFWVRDAVRSGQNINLVAHPEDAMAALRGLLDAHREAFQTISRENAKGLIGKTIGDSVTMTKAELSNLNSLLEGDSLAKYLIGLRGMPETVAKMAYQGGSPLTAAKMAGAAVHGALPDQAYEEAARAVKIAQAAARDPEEHRAAVQAAFDEAARAFPEEDNALVESLATSGDLDMSGGWGTREDLGLAELNRTFLAGFAPARRFFQASYGLKGKFDAWRIAHDVGAMHANLLQRVRDLSNEAARSYGHMSPDGAHSYLQLGFKAWQDGRTDGLDETTAAAVKAVKQIMEGLGEGGEVGGIHRVLGSSLLRTTSHYEYINRLMSRYDGTKSFLFDVEQAERESRAAKISIAEAMANQMTEWNVQDVPAFFDAMNQATIKAVSDASVAAQFMRRAGDLAWHPGKGVPKPRNYVKLFASGESDLAPFLPQDLHMEARTAWMMKRLDAVMRESTQLGDSPLARAVKNYFDPAMQAWKRSATVLHPGHHPRNEAGDFSMQVADAGIRHLGRSYVDSFRILHSERGYDGMDLLKGLESLGVTALDHGKPITTGKFGALSATDIYRAAMERGLIVDAKTIETLEDAANRNLYQKALRAITLQDGVPNKLVSGVTEFREHHAMLSHFAQKIYKAQEDGFVDGVSGKRTMTDVNDMFDAAADDVIKAHPNSLTLAKGERKYLTRAFPFYTWMRGALPFIINASARYPGRALAFPRSSYNLAVAMGVNPQSLSDPFPADAENQLPSFIRDEVQGVQWRDPGGDYFSISPGFSQFDIPNTFLSGKPDPLQSILGGVTGALNPFVKAPLELQSGHSLDTGAEIHDTSDYLDSQIPLLGYLANFSGMSPTGSAVSELTRGTPDAQYQVAKGNKSAGLAQLFGATNPNVQGAPKFNQNREGTDQIISLLNWLTGQGVQDVSKPSFKQFARYERQTARDTSGF